MQSQVKVKRLARINRRITRLSSELETLQFMQDRLERELEPVRGNAGSGSPLSRRTARGRG